MAKKPASSKTTTSPAKKPAPATAPITPTPAATPLRTSPPPKITHDMIARKAYEIWERKGRPIGKDAENWHDAQKALGLL